MPVLINKLAPHQAARVIRNSAQPLLDCLLAFDGFSIFFFNSFILLLGLQLLFFAVLLLFSLLCVGLFLFLFLFILAFIVFLFVDVSQLVLLLFGILLFFS